MGGNHSGKGVGDMGALFISHQFNRFSFPRSLQKTEKNDKYLMEGHTKTLTYQNAALYIYNIYRWILTE